MHSLYTKIVKIIEIYKQFSENLSTNMPTFLAVARLYSHLLGAFRQVWCAWFLSRAWLLKHFKSLM